MSDDDVWGSETIAEEEDNRHGSRSHSELDHEWQARQNQFHTLGYRDGVEAGKHSSVQEGFNLGYAEATVAGFNWGVARGLTRAFAALPDSLKDNLVGESNVRGNLEALDSTIYSYSSTDALRIFHRNINKTREVSVSSSNTLLGSQNIEEIGRVDTASQREGTSVSRDETGSIPIVGINRLPESHSVGVWEAYDEKNAARDDLKELEEEVRRELQSTSIKIVDVLTVPNQ